MILILKFIPKAIALSRGEIQRKKDKNETVDTK